MTDSATWTPEGAASRLFRVGPAIRTHHVYTRINSSFGIVSLNLVQCKADQEVWDEKGPREFLRGL